MFNHIEEVWGQAMLLKESFEEYRLCMAEVYRKAQALICLQADIPEEFQVFCAPAPAEFFSLKKNIFSSLFQSIYRILEIKDERRCLYGKLNHLFRAWVTSADNLLDSEDKVVLPIRMAQGARVMRQVISIMAADRIMKQVLDEAQEDGVISGKDSRKLSDKSLRILLPSAAEEASEEEGILNRPEPGYVLYTIHRLKTGILFHIPFLGPDTVEKSIDQHRLKTAKDGLFRFGLGCQLLDDIRDMAKDYLENRHNYVLSLIYWDNRIGDIKKLKEIEPEISRQDSIFGQFREAVYPAAELARSFLEDGLSRLDDIGLGAGRSVAGKMAGSMFKVLDVGELLGWLENERMNRESLLQDAPLITRPVFMTS